VYHRPIVSGINIFEREMWCPLAFYRGKFTGRLRSSWMIIQSYVLKLTFSFFVIQKCWYNVCLIEYCGSISRKKKGVL
jgi:hypothetical protein